MLSAHEGYVDRGGTVGCIRMAPKIPVLFYFSQHAKPCVGQNVVNLSRITVLHHVFKEPPLALALPRQI